ncbi:MAG: arsenite efflux transporter metallochaperone ArsD [Candidatus Saccharimonadaceae bacterium]|nr:arsenite efflux transporter metallochaperone ArsD [Candidatus Saccharimonadaceae bacterium]
MKKMTIYEPAMCCSTGLCGVGVDSELLRISTVLANLEKNDIKVERYNLTSAPQEFIKNAEVNQLISKGVDILPVIVLDGKVVIIKRYPSNDEFISMLNVPRSYLGEKPKSATKVKVTPKNTGGCGCSGGKCC